MSLTNSGVSRIPREYLQADNEQLRHRILARKNELGEKLLILAHHYQRSEIIEFNDFLGDSFALAKSASKQEQARYIVFCGVRFMAEAADILTDDRQSVYLSHPDAGCPMADMAPDDKVYDAWNHIESVLGSDTVIPLVYMNSTSEMKAFCGKRGGFVCTSSNADLAFRHILDRDKKLFFFPDRHLGRNTSKKLNITGDKVAVYDPEKSGGGLTDDQIRMAEVILWYGYCPVHDSFKPEQIEKLRLAKPGVKVVVHPECPERVVDMADSVGSTSHIVRYVNDAPAGSIIAVGTELTMANRLSGIHPDKEIFGLSGDDCTVCADMNKTTLADLCFILENFKHAGSVKVPESTADYAKIALERMLELGR